MTIHNHGAAKKGFQAENKIKSVTQSVGHTLLKIKKDFEQAEIEEWGTRYHKPPSTWPQTTPKGHQRKYVADGFIPLENNGGIIIELKHSDKHGTTEEKVFYDITKIRYGVYGKKYDLWYVFTGETCKDTNAYKEFEIECKKEKLPVKIIWGIDDFEKELKKLKKGE
tara:strand:+ start:102 stop:602 length:501 start_codon:yes stop_codon:yes gene_type:complete